MKKTLKTYLLLVTILLLNAFANLHASSIFGIQEDVSNQNNKGLLTTYTFEEQQVTIPVFNIPQSGPEHTLFVEIIEENQEENLEESLDISNKLLWLSNPVFSILYAQLFKDISCKVQEYSFRTKYLISNTSLRLHAKFEVFII